MNKEQIFKKAIEKAIENGFIRSWSDKLSVRIEQLSKPTNKGEAFNVVLFDRYNKQPVNVHELIFSHDFAKAFWGEEISINYVICSNKKCMSRERYTWKEDEFLNWKESPYCSTCGDKIHIEKIKEPKENWKKQLQIMVLEKDPIKYLEEFLK